MSLSINELLQVTLGVGSCGAVVWLGFKLLQLMTGHNVLLAGQCVGKECEAGKENADGAQERRSRDRPGELYRYRMRLQNLESVHADYKLCIKIRGIPCGTHAPHPNQRICALVGWKPIDVQLQLGEDPKDPYCWKAVFQALPAFDTWSFDASLPCRQVEFSVAFVGVQQRRAFAPSLGPYFSEDQLTIFAEDAEEPRVRGPVMIPSKSVPLTLSLLALSSHVLLGSMQAWKLDFSRLGRVDLELMALEVALIWVGFIAIRRAVYPVISGYRFVTPVSSIVDKAPIDGKAAGSPDLGVEFLGG
jgi:hypothetical protein